MFHNTVEHFKKIPNYVLKCSKLCICIAFLQYCGVLQSVPKCSVVSEVLWSELFQSFLEFRGNLKCSVRNILKCCKPFRSVQNMLDFSEVIWSVWNVLEHFKNVPNDVEMLLNILKVFRIELFQRFQIFWGTLMCSGVAEIF